MNRLVIALVVCLFCGCQARGQSTGPTSQPAYDDVDSSRDQPLAYDNPTIQEPQQRRRTPPPAPAAEEDYDSQSTNAPRPKLAVCPPIDVPPNFTGTLLIEQPRKVCAICVKLHHAIEDATGVKLTRATTEDSDSNFMYVILQGATDAETEQLFIDRNISSTPTCINFENGREVTRTVGYHGTPAEVQAILVKNPVIRQQMIRQSTRKRTSTRARSRIEYAVDEVPDDDPIPVLTQSGKTLYGMKDGDPIDFRRLPEGLKIRAVDCGNPDHPGIGTVTVRNGRPSFESIDDQQGSNCSQPQQAIPQQAFTTTTVVDCGRPDHPVIGSYQTPIVSVSQSYQPSYAAPNCPQPNYNYAPPQQSYLPGYAPSFANTWGASSSVMPQQYYGGGFSGGCPPGGCPPRYGY